MLWGGDEGCFEEFLFEAWVSGKGFVCNVITYMVYENVMGRCIVLCHRRSREAWYRGAPPSKRNTREVLPPPPLPKKDISKSSIINVFALVCVAGNNVTLP